MPKKISIAFRDMPNSRPVRLLKSIATANSTYYNLRRVESSSYSIWSVVFEQLSVDADIHKEYLLHNPQLCIYHSGADANLPISGLDDIDISFGTAPDPDAVGVVVDHALILPCPQYRWGSKKRPPIGTMWKFLRNVLSKDVDSLARKVTIEALYIPLLGEIKRPPTRHPVNLIHFINDLYKGIVAAMAQAEGQALCLYSSVRFAGQDSVILLAASGHYWTWRIALRSEFFGLGAFDPQKYSELGELFGDEPSVVDIGEATTFCDPSEIDTENSAKLRHELSKALTERNENILQAIREKQKSEREERAQRYAQARDAWLEAVAKAFEQAWKLNDSIPEGTFPYTTKQLNDCYQHMRNGEMLAHQTVRSMGSVFAADDDSTSLPTNDREWSPIMKLGTQVSDCHLEYIGKQLAKIVNKEMLALRMR